MLEAEGCLVQGRWSAPRADHPLQTRLHKALRKRLKASPALRSLLTVDVLACADALVGGRNTRGFSASSTPQLLFTAPDAESWRVPHNGWHLDLPRAAEVGFPGVQAFTFLAPTPSGAGGTLVLEGSHRFLNDVDFLPSADVKRWLARRPELKSLFDPRLADRSALREAEFEMDGVVLRVRELVGEPGDVWFTDLRVLHTLALNASAMPRLMATERFVIDSAFARLQQPSA